MFAIRGRVVKELGAFHSFAHLHLATEIVTRTSTEQVCEQDASTQVRQESGKRVGTHESREAHTETDW